MATAVDCRNAEGGGGNRVVTHVELGEDKSLFGHDTFLLDLVNVGAVVVERVLK